jgi:hypothetical protein
VRRFVLLPAVIFCCALSGFGSTIPCPGAQTLQTYISLGACESGVFMLSDFHFAANGSTGGTTSLLTAGQIDVVFPNTSGPGAFEISFQPLNGHEFVAQGSASGTHTATYGISYTITSPANVGIGRADLNVVNAAISCTPGCSGLADYTVTTNLSGGTFMVLQDPGNRSGFVNQSASALVNGANQVAVNNVISLSGLYFSLGSQNFEGTAQIGDGGANAGRIENLLGAVPEPAAALLLGSGLITLGLLIKIKRRS